MEVYMAGMGMGGGWGEGVEGVEGVGGLMSW